MEIAIRAFGLAKRNLDVETVGHRDRLEARAA